jgi:hypothetical protein
MRHGDYAPLSFTHLHIVLPLLATVGLTCRSAIRSRLATLLVIERWLGPEMAAVQATKQQTIRFRVVLDTERTLLLTKFARGWKRHYTVDE